MSEQLLKVALAGAVPLWIERVHEWTPEERAEKAAAAVDVIASKGDVILYRGGKPGETAEAFNTLAKAIAILAYQPGGVEIFGSHWEVVPARS